VVVRDHLRTAVFRFLNHRAPVLRGRSRWGPHAFPMPRRSS
jgi:hypothetical protein